jgi:hypothetical protein
MIFFEKKMKPDEENADDGRDLDDPDDNGNLGKWAPKFPIDPERLAQAKKTRLAREASNRPLPSWDELWENTSPECRFPREDAGGVEEG